MQDLTLIFSLINYPEDRLLKYITVFKETKVIFKNTGKTCWVKVSKEKKVIIYAADSEIYTKADVNIACFNFLLRITITECYKKLELRLKELKSLLTLQNYLYTLLSFDLKKIPSDIYFKKTTILYWTSNIDKKILLAYWNLKSLI